MTCRIDLVARRLPSELVLHCEKADDRNAWLRRAAHILPRKPSRPDQNIGACCYRYIFSMASSIFIGTATTILTYASQNVGTASMAQPIGGS